MDRLNDSIFFLAIQYPWCQRWHPFVESRCVLFCFFLKTTLIYSVRVARRNVIKQWVNTTKIVVKWSIYSARRYVAFYNSWMKLWLKTNFHVWCLDMLLRSSMIVAGFIDFKTSNVRWMMCHKLGETVALEHMTKKLGWHEFFFQTMLATD